MCWVDALQQGDLGLELGAGREREGAEVELPRRDEAWGSGKEVVGGKVRAVEVPFRRQGKRNETP